MKYVKALKGEIKNLNGIVMDSGNKPFAAAFAAVSKTKSKAVPQNATTSAEAEATALDTESVDSTDEVVSVA